MDTSSDAASGGAAAAAAAAAEAATGGDAEGKKYMLETKDGPVEVSDEFVKYCKTLRNMLEDIEWSPGDDPIPIDICDKKTIEAIQDYITQVAPPLPTFDDAAGGTADPESEDEAEQEAAEADKGAAFLKALVDKRIEEGFTVPASKGPLFEITLAANFLDFKALLSATAKVIADFIRGKTTEQIRDQFGIINDFTPEEEEKVKEENKWCEDVD